MLAQHHVRLFQADVFRAHDLVGARVVEHAVLVDARFVGEGVLADDRLVADDDRAGGAGQHARDMGELPRVDARRQSILVRADAHGHDQLFQRAVAGAFADAVDRAFDLARAGLQRGQRIGDGQAQIVVTVRRIEQVRHVGQRSAQVGEDAENLVRRRIADGVRDIQRGGACLGDFAADLVQKVGLGANGVLGRKLDLVEQLRRIGDAAHADFQHLVARLLQLGGAVDRRGGQKDVDARALGGLQGAGGGVEVAFQAARQGTQGDALDLGRHGVDSGFVTGRGGGETRLDDVDAQGLQGVGHLQLVLDAQRKAGGLLAVTQAGIENEDPVRVLGMRNGHALICCLACSGGAAPRTGAEGTRLTPYRRSI